MEVDSNREPETGFAGEYCVRTGWIVDGYGRVGVHIGDECGVCNALKKQKGPYWPREFVRICSLDLCTASENSRMYALIIPGRCFSFGLPPRCVCLFLAVPTHAVYIFLGCRYSSLCGSHLDYWS